MHYYHHHHAPALVNKITATTSTAPPTRVSLARTWRPLPGLL